MLIYKITNQINNKPYTGYTGRTLRERWKGHCVAAKYGSDLHLHRAIRKDGEENFTIEQVCKYKNPDHTKILETFFIKKFDSYHNGYNMTEEGGQGGNFTEEHIKKLSEMNKGRIFSEEHRRKISVARMGIKFSEETKRKMSKSRMGIRLSEETRKKMSKIHMGNKYCLGHKLTEEHKRKIGEAGRGRIVSAETRKKMSEKMKGNTNGCDSFKGKHHTEETKKKISKSLKRRKYLEVNVN